MEVIEIAVLVAVASLTIAVAPSTLRLTRRIAKYQLGRVDDPNSQTTMLGFVAWLVAYCSLLLGLGFLASWMSTTSVGVRFTELVDRIVSSLPRDLIENPLSGGAISLVLLVGYFAVPAGCVYGVVRAFRADHQTAKDSAGMAAMAMFVVAAGYWLVAGG